jgi:nicotinate-nucleotide adenylyltransferase
VIGVLGGTFDPVHFGHLHAAECVRRVFAPERILLVPCATPPHKGRTDLSPAEHRLAMLRLAAESREWLEVSEIEIARGGISYTVETLRELARGTPPVSPVFIMGMDSLFEIHTWKSHLDLIREFDLVVVDRPGRDLGRAREQLYPAVADRLVTVSFSDGAAARLAAPPPGRGGRVYHLPIPPLAVSSSEIRSEAAVGATLDGLVPPSVARYIRDHRLYGQEGTP